MINLPKDWPMFCRDVKQEMSMLGLMKDDLPPQDESRAHNALADAIWTRDAHRRVEQIRIQTGISEHTRVAMDAWRVKEKWAADR